MKIIFVKIHIGGPNTGLTKKIFGQIQNLTDLGVDAKLVLITDDKNKYPQLDYLECIEIKNIGCSYSLLNIVEIINRQRTIGRILKKNIQTLDNSDILYFRFPFPTFFLPLNIFKKNRTCKIVSEHNKIEWREFFFSKNYSFLLYDFLFGKIVRNQLDGLIGVTDEIVQYEIRKSGNTNIPHMTISNGINVQEYPLKKFAPFVENELNILCLAKVSPWHGWDRLLQGLSLYTGTVKIRLHIVGDGSEVLHLQKFSFAIKHCRRYPFLWFPFWKRSERRY